MPTSVCMCVGLRMCSVARCSSMRACVGLCIRRRTRTNTFQVRVLNASPHKRHDKYSLSTI